MKVRKYPEIAVADEATVLRRADQLLEADPGGLNDEGLNDEDRRGQDLLQLKYISDFLMVKAGDSSHSERMKLVAGLYRLLGRSVTNFGQIPAGGRFFYLGRQWTRTRGLFALPTDSIGSGHVGWPFSVDTIVEPRA